MDHELIFNFVKKHQWNELIKFIQDNEHLDVNITDNTGNHLIHYLILFNQKTALSLIISRGARLDIVDNDKRSIIYYAIKYTYEDILELLLNFNKITIGIPLVDIKDIYGNTPLHYSIEFNNLNATTKLLDNSANPEIKNKKGISCLHMAIELGYIEIIRLLLKKKVNVNITDYRGETLLHYAIKNKRYNILDLLLKENIDINLYDNFNHYTALNYAINLADDKLINSLINTNKVNFKHQDFYGNNYIHQAINETSIKTLFKIIKNIPLSDIELTQFNIDGKLIIHYAIEKSSVDIIKLFLNISDLTFQDIEGNTPLHLIFQYNLFNDLKKELKSSFLINPYLKNNKNKSVLDIINDNETKNKIINLTNILYLNSINKKDIKDWQSKCIKNYQNNTNCAELIKNELTKENIKLKYDKSIDFCSFTGLTIDVLIGQLYLLKKYNNVQSIIPKKFYKNNKLCDFYKKNNINIMEKCEFLNFQILFINNNLFVPDFFESIIEQKIKSKTRFIIISIGIESGQDGHANYIIIDTKTKTIERFEPNGSNIPQELINKDTNTKSLLNFIDNKISILFESFEMEYLSPMDYLPKIGFQLMDIYQNEKNIGDPEGFCALWCIWYTEQRIINESLNPKELVKKLIKEFKKNKISPRKMIRNYSSRIVSIRDKILKKANTNINEWKNKKSSQQSIDKVVSLIGIEIRSHM